MILEKTCLHFTSSMCLFLVGWCRYGAGVGFLLPFQPPHLLKATGAKKAVPGMVDLRGLIPMSTAYSKVSP